MLPYYAYPYYPFQSPITWTSGYSATSNPNPVTVTVTNTPCCDCGEDEHDVAP